MLSLRYLLDIQIEMPGSNRWKCKSGMKGEMHQPQMIFKAMNWMRPPGEEGQMEKWYETRDLGASKVYSTGN